jgi:hypothetical protein
MPRYFNEFPKLIYTRDNVTNLLTNLLTRVAKVKDEIDTSSLYYEYYIKDGDTPEIIASKYYGDAELHWVILIFNDIIDPYYDWPMEYRQFQSYITDKYTNQRYALDTTLSGNLVFSNTTTSVIGTGTNFTTELTVGSKLFYFGSAQSNLINFIATVDSIEDNTHLTLTANSSFSANTQTYNEKVMTGIHHFEKTIQTTDNTSGKVTTRIYTIDLESYKALPAEPTEFINNQVKEITSRGIVSLYDYENELNESKRQINLVRRELIGTIKNQFKQLMSA